MNSALECAEPLLSPVEMTSRLRIGDAAHRDRRSARPPAFDGYFAVLRTPCFACRYALAVAVSKTTPDCEAYRRAILRAPPAARSNRPWRCEACAAFRSQDSRFDSAQRRSFYARHGFDAQDRETAVKCHGVGRRLLLQRPITQRFRLLWSARLRSSSCIEIEHAKKFAGPTLLDLARVSLAFRVPPLHEFGANQADNVSDDATHDERGEYERANLVFRHRGESKPSP